MPDIVISDICHVNMEANLERAELLLSLNDGKLEMNGNNKLLNAIPISQVAQVCEQQMKPESMCWRWRGAVTVHRTTISAFS